MPTGQLGPSRVALVTGAGRGLGRHLAVGLAESGLAVGLVGRTIPMLEETANRCRAAGAIVTVAPADVTDRNAVGLAVAAISRECGPVDLLVNNAGRIEPVEAAFADVDPDDFWAVVETNLRGPALLSHAVLPGMIRRGGGRIVNVNSGFGYRVGDVYTGYAVSKGALARFTAMLAHQYRRSGVVALDISPGLVRSDMTSRMPMWAGPDTNWNPPEHFVETVLAVAHGRLDDLSGCFVHAVHDDLDSLIARASQVKAADARVVRLVPYGPDDPLGG